MESIYPAAPLIFTFQKEPASGEESTTLTWVPGAYWPNTVEAV